MTTPFGSGGGLRRLARGEERRAGSRRPYRRPRLTLLGDLADVTRGMNGSNWDPGQNNNTKKGAG